MHFCAFPPLGLRWRGGSPGAVPSLAQQVECQRLRATHPPYAAQGYRFLRRAVDARLMPASEERECGQEAFERSKIEVRANKVCEVSIGDL